MKVLGTGTYGKVMLVRHKKTEKLYAMKVLKKAMIREKKQVEHTKTERRVLERIKHPFIVRMKYAFADREKLYFVLDYCHGGELFFYLTNLRRFKEDAARFYAANVLLGARARIDATVAATSFARTSLAAAMRREFALMRGAYNHALEGQRIARLEAHHDGH